MSNMQIDENDLATNPTPRVPICLLLDTSYSMTGAPIDELNEGVKLFIEALKSDEIACYSADVTVITFGGSVDKILDFGPINDLNIPTLIADGDTPMGEAAEEALRSLEMRKREYKDEMVEYFQPWMVLMTDGQPTDNHESSARKISNLIQDKKMTIFPIGIGDGVDMNVLKEFSPTREPLKLRGLNFKGFFEWLSQSVTIVSQSIPGDKIKLDTDGISSWAEL